MKLQDWVYVAVTGFLAACLFMQEAQAQDRFLNENDNPTCTLSATDNAVLDAIDTNTDALESLIITLDAVVDAMATDMGTTAANTSTTAGDTTNLETLQTALIKAEGAALGSGVLLQGDDGTDRTNVAVDTDGHLQCDIQSIAQPTSFYASENHSTAQTNNQLVAAPGAGVSLCVTDIVISNGATAGEVKLVEDTAGTPADVFETVYVAANGGAVIQLQTPKCLTANKDLGFTSTTVTTHTVTVSGYQE